MPPDWDGAQLSCLADEHISQLRALILGIAVHHLVMHLPFEEQVYVTFPSKAYAAMALHRSARGESSGIAGGGRRQAP